MAVGWFVTGTDTGVGKTRVAAALVHAFSERGARTVGMKPVASGCERTAAGLRNEDALALIAASPLPVAYEDVNPYTFEPAIAPHVAADLAGSEIRFEPLEAAYRRLAAGADRVIVEGAGGWRVPFGRGRFQSDLARHLELDVVLVVGLRLGCLNHAILTAEAIKRDGLRLVGWIGSRIDPGMPYVDENVATLRETLPAPCLGVLPYEPDPPLARTAGYITLG